MSPITFGLLGFSLGALGCGGKEERAADGNPSATTTPAPALSAPSSSAAPVASADVGVAGGEMGNGAGPPAPGRIGAPPAMIGQTGRDSQAGTDSRVRSPSGREEVLANAQLLQAEGERALITYCGSCHGPVSSDGGLGHIEDMGSLIAGGFAIPCAVDASPIVQRIRDQSMPPPGSYLPVSRNDSNAVACAIALNCELPDGGVGGDLSSCFIPTGEIDL
jgi:hypothetical protein